MKRMTFLLILTALTFIATPMLAGEQGLYFNLGLGWADPTYGDDLDPLLDELEDLPGVDHTTGAVDLGLYWPVGTSAMLGPALTVMGDRFEDSTAKLDLYNYMLGISYRQYLSGERGKGFFIRGDGGMAKLKLEATGLPDQTSDMGFGVLFGGGYSFQIGGGTWFSLNADYTIKAIESETVGGLTIGGAFLF